jgi:hypothetical protein
MSSFVPSSSERLSVVSEAGVTSWSFDGLKTSDTPGVFVPVSPYTLGGAYLTPYITAEQGCKVQITNHIT